MMVFKLASDLSRYTMLGAVDERDVEAGLQFDGSVLGDRWKAYSVSPIVGELEGQTEVGDFSELYGVVPVFSARAVERLRTLLEESGELLPLRSSSGAYFAYNVTRIVDALDIERTKAVWLAPGRILDVAEYAFIPERLCGASIFKLPQQLSGPVFVTDHFIESLGRAGITGFAPKFLWKDQ